VKERQLSDIYRGKIPLLLSKPHILAIYCQPDIIRRVTMTAKKMEDPSEKPGNEQYKLPEFVKNPLIPRSSIKTSQPLDL